MTAIWRRIRIRILPLISLLPMTFLIMSNKSLQVMVESRGRNDQKQNTTKNDACSLLPRDTSPSRWWIDHFDDIVSSSLLFQDDAPKSLIQSLLASLSPKILQRGIKTRPQSLDRIAMRLYNRAISPSYNKPLQILVVGGSLARGHGCSELGGEKNATRQAMHPSKCAWPNRLEHAVNTLSNTNLVQVYNVAVGATNLKFGTAILKYRLFPEELKKNGGPDIIICGYATNEQASVITDTTRAEWRNAKRDALQEFIEAAATTRIGCNNVSQQPHVVFVDEYIGNRQGFIERESSFKEVVNQVSEWYSSNTMHVSYADVVRPFVYGDTNDTYFSSAWSEERPVNVHFGVSGHVATAWSILYAMMDVMIGYCDSVAFETKMNRLGERGVVAEHVRDLVTNIPPPKLQPSLSLHNVSHEWQLNSIRRHKKQEKWCSNNESPCEFALLAGPESTVRSTSELAQYIDPFVIQNTGWEPVGQIQENGYVKKLGLAAMHANASIILHFSNIQQPIRIINVQRLKSFGKKWANSMARFTLRFENPNGKVLHSHFDLSGYHNDSTSVSYAFERHVKKANRGSNVTVSIDLIGGKTFKIIGLMLCNE